MAASRWDAIGIPRHLVRSLAASGDLVRMRQGVYATRVAVRWAGTDATRRHVLHVLAARATVGQHAVASYHSAVRLHRLDLLNSLPEETVTLTLPPDKPWNRARQASVVFHTADLPAEQLARLYSLPVTTAARTVIDLARTLPFTDAVVTADSALRAEKTTKPELGKVLDACARWPGIRQARRVVEFADERAESPLESAARVVFDQSGFDSPELQATVFTPADAFRVDFLWRAHRVIAEADGLGKYSDHGDAIKQLERDRRLRDAGFQVVHFTWKELFGTPELVPGRIRAAIAATTPY
jgi:very-short-patch-repair endonuclease/predicted transcriptional regulator of viral defense system